MLQKFINVLFPVLLCSGNTGLSLSGSSGSKFWVQYARSMLSWHKDMIYSKVYELIILNFLLLSKGSRDNPTKPVQLKKRIKLNPYPRLNKQQLNLNSLGVVPSDFTESGLTTKGTIQLLAGSGSVLLNTDRHYLDIFNIRHIQTGLKVRGES